MGKLSPGDTEAAQNSPKGSGREQEQAQAAGAGEVQRNLQEMLSSGF